MNPRKRIAIAPNPATDLRPLRPPPTDVSTPAKPPAILMGLQEKLTSLLWTFPGASERQRELAIVDAQEMFLALEPAGILDELTIERIVIARVAANVCASIAGLLAIKGLPAAAKYTDLYRKYSDEQLKWQRELQRSRGRADQSMLVQHQHVTVADGGQAIVGNVGVTRQTGDTSPGADFDNVHAFAPPGVRLRPTEPQTSRSSVAPPPTRQRKPVI